MRLSTDAARQIADIAHRIVNSCVCGLRGVSRFAAATAASFNRQINNPRLMLDS